MSSYTMRFEPTTGRSSYRKAGSLLRDARNQLYYAESPMTLRDAADECGVSPTLMSFIENGKEAPSERIMPTIARVYQVNENALRLLYGQPSKGDQKWMKRVWESRLGSLSPR